MAGLLVGLWMVSPGCLVVSFSWVQLGPFNAARGLRVGVLLLTGHVHELRKLQGLQRTRCQIPRHPRAPPILVLIRLLLIDIRQFLPHSNLHDAELERDRCRPAINKILAQFMHQILLIIHIGPDDPEPRSTDMALVYFGVENVVDVDLFGEYSELKIERYVLSAW